MRRAAKIDNNHKEVASALQKLGCSVLSLAGVGRGCADILAQRGGKFWLIEVKGKYGKLTPDQEIFHKLWPVSVVRTLDDVVNLIEK